MPTNPLTAIVKKAFDDACCDFSVGVAERGFTRTKTRLWVRLNDSTIDVISLFRAGSSYGAPIGGTLDIRLSSSGRLFNDMTEYLALNGPQSDIARTRDGKYHLRFNAKSRHMYERCITDLIRFLDSECEPWFADLRLKNPSTPDTILVPSAESRKLLGLDRILDSR
jgi:hypothetical protein